MLAAADERWSNYLYILGTAYPRFLWRFFEYSGDGLVWLAIALTAFLQPRATLPQQALVLNFLAGWALDLALVGALKVLIRRRRPVYNVAEDFLLVVAVDAHSFPSGHAARCGGARAPAGDARLVVRQWDVPMLQPAVWGVWYWSMMGVSRVPLAVVTSTSLATHPCVISCRIS